MERCYTCNHCGKCEALDFAIEQQPYVCLDCNHEVQPGESFSVCAVCGSTRIEKSKIGVATSNRS